MKQKKKLPLNEIFMALDMDAKGAYKEWSEEERKELNFWLLNRYASSVGGSQDAKEWAVIATNEYYNGLTLLTKQSSFLKICFLK